MIKTAHLTGQIHALAQLGFTETQIKTACVNSGLSTTEAKALVKEAGIPGLGLIGKMIGKGIMGGGRALAQGAGRISAGGASRAMAPAQQGMKGMLGRGAAKGMQAAGGLGQRAGIGMMQSGRAFAKNPLKALGKGTLEAGKGALFMGGKGVGGTIGKGMFGAQMASMALPGKAPTPYAPQPYGMNFQSMRNGG